jgi:uncharacterized damage-inducible protein DinB
VKIASEKEQGRLVQTGAPLWFCWRKENTMKPEEMRALFAFNAWANQKMLGAAEALTTEQFTKPLGSSFSSVRDTLAHVCGVEWVWLERLQGRSPASIPDAKEYGTVEALRVRWTELEARLLAYVGRLSQAELDEVVEYKTLSFGLAQNPRWQIMQHVVNHGTYHRGQVTTMLRQLGAKSVGTDLILFYRERNAATAA